MFFIFYKIVERPKFICAYLVSECGHVWNFISSLNQIYKHELLNQRHRLPINFKQSNFIPYMYFDFRLTLFIKIHPQITELVKEVSLSDVF